MLYNIWYKVKGDYIMSMHMIRGVQVHGRSKKKKQKPVDMKSLEIEWRRYNKDMRRKNMFDLQFESLDDYAAYKQGNYKPKKKKEFKSNAPSPKPYVRNTTQNPSLKTSDTVPGSCSKRESQVYSGERKLLGIATMHKSNMVPVFADNKEQAVEIAQMRRN